MKSYSETRKDSWLWKAKAPRVDVLARPEKLKKIAQIWTKRSRMTFLFTRKFTRRVSTEDCWTLNDFLYIPRQQILTMVKTESETYRLKASRKTRPWSSKNSIVFRSFVPVLRQIRKGISSNLFFPLQMANENKKTEELTVKGEWGLQYTQSHMLRCGRKRSSSSQKIQEALTEMVSVGGCAVHESRRGSPCPSPHPFPQYRQTQNVYA
jgi:hypothetical protein